MAAESPCSDDTASNPPTPKQRLQFPTSGSAVVRRPQTLRGQSSREVVRKKLANNNPDQADNLLICFVNEAVYEEDEEAVTSEVIEDKALRAVEAANLEDLSAQYIARNNISRKKGHVIVPLTPTTPNGGCKTSVEVIAEDESKLKEKQFSVYLKRIKCEARERLKKAKSEAKEVMRAESENGGNKVFLHELTQLLGLPQIKSSSSSSSRSRRLSRQVLTDMNIGQLQVILNFMLSRIENLNEKLVKDLMTRDELVMEQDSLLTDIEDITKGVATDQHSVL